MRDTEVQVQPHPSVVFTQLDASEAVLLHLETKRYYSLNETGSRIWSLLQRAGTSQRISHLLLEEYDSDQEETRDLVSSFLTQLKEAGLVEERAP